MLFEDAFAQCRVIAILRGLQPDESVAVCDALYAAGIRVAEVPLNSPNPFDSIARLAKAFAGRMAVGAGTVLSVADVNMLKQSGGSLSISPDCNPEVIAQARSLGLEPIPGVFTPTEAFAALRAGARHLKLFPAEAASPATIKAWRAVLPTHVQIHAVGGITPANMKSWLDAGASGFGVGSNLFKPGKSLSDVSRDAALFVAADQQARNRT